MSPPCAVPVGAKGRSLGFNAVSAGFKHAQDMVTQMCQSESAQLAGMVGFMRSEGLDAKLRARNWAGFARGYKRRHVLEEPVRRQAQGSV